MTTDLTARQAAALKPWTPTFAMSVEDAVEQVRRKREFMQRVMREGEHYGTIPGTPKPSLWKPGAELLLSSMGLHCVVSVAESVRDYTGRDHGGESFVEFLCTGTVYRQIGMRPEERMIVAQADGLCNSWETKYRYRDAKRRCPDCQQETIYESRKDPGWFCWKTKGGCGHEFPVGDQRITGQPLGKVPNPDIADVVNTVLKIGGKRAYVAATLLGTGCSDIFTQDLSDDEDDPGAASERTPTSGRRPANGNGRPAAAGGAAAATGSLTPDQEAELRELNEQLGDKKWAPAMLKGKMSRPFNVTKAELEALLGGAQPPAPPPAQDEPGEEGRLL